MDTAMIHRRHFPKDHTGEACLRRLRLFTSHELMRRVPPLVTYAAERAGRLPLIHCLTPHCAEVLQELTGIRPKRVFVRDPQPQTVLHRLFVAHVMLTVHDAAKLRQLPAPVWIVEHDRVARVAPDTSRSERYVLYEDFAGTDGTVITCRPDAACC
jgi:hypothetical protein